MNIRISRPLFVLIGTVILLSAAASFAKLDFSKWPPAHQKVIFDADINQDCDDVGAITVLHKFADAGYCDIIAMGTSVPRNRVALGIDAFNTYYGRPDIPIGRVKRTNGGEAVFQWLFSEYGYSSTAIKYPCNLDTSNVVEACLLYKDILARQPDSSVTIVITGYPTNVAQLLLLPGGMDIVRKKVKMVVQMGGSQACCCGGREGNFYVDALSSKILADSLPVPIVYSGFEVGAHVYSGAGFQSQPASSPARAAYAGANFSRSSWDPCAMLFALAGLGPASNPYFKIGGDSGYQTVSLKDSTNKWICSDAPGRASAGFIYQIGSGGSDANLVRVLDSLYALPNKSTAANASVLQIGNRPGIKKVTIKSGVLRAEGLADGIIELFDESGRMLHNARVINGRASVAELTRINARTILYRLNRDGRSIVSGKTIIR